MLKIDTDKTINITRGDTGSITISANDSAGNSYSFAINDIVRLKVMVKDNVNNIVLKKDVKVTSVGTTVNMDLDSADTKIGNYINKPVTYWYEIELNPDTSPITIIGYDNDGPKKFILYPEAGETT